MQLENKDELDRRGYQECAFCRFDSGDGYLSAMLNNADPEDMGLSPMGERP